MSRSVVLKSYRVGNVVVELKRSDRGGKKGIVDFYDIYRLYVKTGTGMVEKIRTFGGRDMRDLLSLMIVLTANTIDIKEEGLYNNLTKGAQDE